MSEHEPEVVLTYLIAREDPYERMERELDANGRLPLMTADGKQIGWMRRSDADESLLTYEPMENA